MTAFFFKHDRLIQEFSDSYLGPGKIAHNQAMTLEFCRHSPYTADILTVPLQSTMGEVEPRHIHSLQNQALKNGFRTGGRADGADDFGLISRQFHGTITAPNTNTRTNMPMSLAFFIRASLSR